MSERAARITVALGFVASRLAFHAAGVRFDTSPLPWFWQYLDPKLLMTDLARSLFYLHAQPPLFNAFLGGVLKLAGGWASPTYHGVFLAIGLAIALLLFDLLRRVGLGRGAAIALTLFYVASPTALLYEKWLMYTQVETGLLVLAAWSIARLGERGGFRAALPYLGAIAALGLTRSLFHVAWVFACVGLAFVATRPPRRHVLVGGAAALALVGALYAKNFALFDVPAASSWFGMNLANLVQDRWTGDERQALIAQGVVSPLMAIPPFSPLDAYDASLTAIGGPDVPALRERLKTGGESNYNHFAYVAISQAYQRDARILIASDPARYAGAVWIAWQKFLLSPSNYVFVEPNRQRIRAWTRLYDVLYGVPSAWSGVQYMSDYTVATPTARRICWLWLVLCVGAESWAAIAIVRALFTGRARGAAPAPPLLSPRLAAIAFCAFSGAYVAFTANALEFGENNRFRAPIEPLLLVLVAFGVREWWPRRAPPGVE